MPDLRLSVQEGTSAGGSRFRRSAHLQADGRSLAEHWEIEDAGHRWSGGQAAGSHTYPAGADASRAMMRFFLQLPL